MVSNLANWKVVVPGEGGAKIERLELDTVLPLIKREINVLWLLGLSRSWVRRTFIFLGFGLWIFFLFDTTLWVYFLDYFLDRPIFFQHFLMVALALADVFCLQTIWELLENPLTSPFEWCLKVFLILFQKFGIHLIFLIIPLPVDASLPILFRLLRNNGILFFSCLRHCFFLLINRL